MRTGAAIDSVRAEVYEIPTDRPEGDGTFAWSKTVMVVVRAASGDTEGIGWTYAAGAAKAVVDQVLAGAVVGGDALDVPAAYEAMGRACRNIGREGIAACALSAVDIALWDLKGRLMDVYLGALMGRARKEVPVYGSGGFTTYDDEATARQIEDWVSRWSIPRVKIKVGESWGSRPERDLQRVALVRRVAGDGVEVFVDANGGYTRKQAVRMGRRFADEHGVTWFEEPVSSDDLAGLREVRELCDADVAAGEYGWQPWYFTPMLQAGAVDCLQADATRCGGYTGWLQVAASAAAHHVDLSGHCAPNLHVPVALAAPRFRHLEYFHDHSRIEGMLFDGCISPEGGAMRPDSDRPGHGMSLRNADAEVFRTA